MSSNISTHNLFKFPYENNKEITFNSEFDSGNCGKVVQK